MQYSKSAPSKKAVHKEKSSVSLKSVDSVVQEADGGEDGKPWNCPTRPVWADPPRDNSFTLEDEGHAAAVESIMSVFCVSDPLQQDNPLVFVSPAFEKMSGYPSEELLGENCNLLQRKKGEQGAVDEMRAALSARRFTAVQVSNYRKDGKKFNNLVCLLPVLDCNDNLRLYVGVQSDLDRRADKGAGAIAKWPEQVSHYLKAFAVTDNAQEHAPFIAANEAFSDMTGYGQAELRGCGVLTLGGPDTSRSSLKKLLSNHWADKASGVRMLCYRKNGSPFWGYVWNCPLWDRSQGNGPCKRHLVVVFDITTTKLKRMGKFVLGKVIGQGASGIVYMGLNAMTEEVVAIKSVDASRFRSISEIEQIQEEMNVSASLKHPNIVRLFEVHFNNNVFYLVMELSPGGSLMKYIHESTHLHYLDEADTHRLFLQMVSALDYCHRKRIIHRDLKPENILMDKDNNIKVADFGLSAISGFSSTLTQQCGTPEFSAPEITTGKEYEGSAIDIWSLGVILYEMLSGKLPFSGTTQPLLFKCIQRGVYEPLPNTISEECRDLLGGMLTVEPSRRITMDDIVSHPWLRRHVDVEAHDHDRAMDNSACPQSPAMCPLSPINRVAAAAEAALMASMCDGMDDPMESTSRSSDTNTFLGGSKRGSYSSGTHGLGSGNMHDSVRIVINGGDKDDPITAAMMRMAVAADDAADAIKRGPPSITSGNSRGQRTASVGGSAKAPSGPQSGTDASSTRLRADMLESRNNGKSTSSARSDVGGVRPAGRAGDKSSTRSDVGAPPSLRSPGTRKPGLPPLNNTVTAGAPSTVDRRPTHEVAKDMMSRAGRTASLGATSSPVDRPPTLIKGQSGGETSRSLPPLKRG